MTAGISKFHLYFKGPWELDPACTADYHNTIRAAQGRAGGQQPGAAVTKYCVCPRSRALVGDNATMRAAAARARRQKAAASMEALFRKLALHTPKTPRPDMDGALCTRALPKVDAAFAGRNLGRMKALCERCPARVECLNWAMKANEQDGVWGGTTPAERERMRRKAS